jgi:hypothetical protein
VALLAAAAYVGEAGATLVAAAYLPPIREVLMGFERSRTARHGLAALLLVVLLASACASAGGGGGGGRANSISRDQFNPDDENAFLIIRRLRPSWLRPRTQGTITNPEPAFPQVYLDQTHLGDANVLESISAAQIGSIEYMDALDATTRYGTGFTGGLIIVRTVNSGR